MGAIWTPGGMPMERTTVNLPPEFLKMLAVLGETSGQINLGIHCSICKENLAGKNGSGDRRWILECACRTFTGVNPTKAN